MHQIFSFHIVFIISYKWVKYSTGKCCINLQLEINLLIVKNIRIALIYLYFLKIILKIIPAPLHSSLFDFFSFHRPCNLCVETPAYSQTSSDIIFWNFLFILFFCYSTKFKNILANANKTINQNIWIWEGLKIFNTFMDC